MVMMSKMSITEPALDAGRPGAPWACLGQQNTDRAFDAGRPSILRVPWRQKHAQWWELAWRNIFAQMLIIDFRTIACFFSIRQHLACD